MSMSWIKMRTALIDHPIVEQIADIINEDPQCVIGRLFCVWAWLDDHTVDGKNLNTSRRRLDARAGLVGFADAMIQAGWITGDDGDFTFTNFGKYNGKTAKDRALGARRAAVYRGSKASNPVITDASRSERDESVTAPLPREDKRRVEIDKSKTKRGQAPQPPASFDWEDAPDGLNTKAVRSAMGDWDQHRRENRWGSWKPRTMKTKLKEYEGRPDDLVAAVSHSIGNGYQGLFAPKGNHAKNGMSHAQHADSFNHPED